MVLFDKEDSKIIAEYYAANYTILSSSGGGNKVNARRTNLIKELAKLINSRHPTVPVTSKQVRQKIQDLKKNVKRKNSHNNRVRRPTGGGTDETVQLSVAEEVMVAKLGNTPAFRGMPGGGMESRGDNPLDKSQLEKSSDSEDDHDEDDATSVQSQAAISQMQHPSQLIREQILSSRSSIITEMRPLFESPIIASQVPMTLNDAPGPSSQRTTNTVTGQTSRARRGNAIQDMADDQKKILKLQKETLQIEKEVRMQQLKATEEFRRFILERRMQMRGVNLATAPLIISDDLIDFRNSLMSSIHGNDDTYAFDPMIANHLHI